MQKILIPIICLMAFAACKKPDGKNAEQTTMNEVDTILVGTYTNEGSEGIYKLAFNNNTGSIEGISLATNATNPTFLAWNEDKTTFYAVNAVDGRGGISSYAWNNGQTSLTNHLSPEESSPCHVVLSNNGKLAASANYGTGGVAVYSIEENGDLGSITGTAFNTGEFGPTSRQKGPHAHCGMFSKDDEFLYIVDLGLDEVLAYPVADDGSMGEAQSAIKMEPGDGPRHMIFNKAGDKAFVVNELSSSVVSFNVDKSTGKLSVIDRKSTLPEGYTEDSFCADIHLSPDEKFLYASNRGHNSIAVYAVANDGKLTLVQIEPEEIVWPRNFMVHPGGKYMLVANQNANSVTVYSIDPATGKIAYTGEKVEVSSPVCLAIK
ncbi:MAG: lactonase family protein [Cyclobacteriaceae bacterium]